MANKLAPYNDKEIIRGLLEFLTDSSLDVAKLMFPVGDVVEVAYRAYLEWQLTSETADYRTTLNCPQFSKALRQAVLAHEATRDLSS